MTTRNQDMDQVTQHYVVMEHGCQNYYETLDKAEECAENLANENQSTCFNVYIVVKVFKTIPVIKMKTISSIF